MNGCKTLIFRWGMREKKMLLIAVLGQLQKLCTSLRNVNVEVYNSFLRKINKAGVSTPYLNDLDVIGSTTPLRKICYSH